MRCYRLPAITLHKMLRSGEKPRFFGQGEDEFRQHEAIDNIILKKARKEGMQRLDNVQRIIWRWETSAERCEKEFSCLDSYLVYC
jgi:hypothetical protein